MHAAPLGLYSGTPVAALPKRGPDTNGVLVQCMQHSWNSSPELQWQLCPRGALPLMEFSCSARSPVGTIDTVFCLRSHDEIVMHAYHEQANQCHVQIVERDSAACIGQS